MVNNLIGTANGTNAGDTINYAISITNAGEATLTDLTAVIDSATDTAPAECPVVELEGGASTTCTASYVINQADVDTGEVTKQVTVSGQDESSGEIVSVSDTSTFQLSPAPVAILALATELQVIELNDIIGVNAGDQIRYAFDVTNTGALTLSQISIEEDADKLGEIACDESTLAPGASTTCTAVYEVTPADELDLGVVTQTTALAVTLQGDPVISLPSEDTVETTPVGVDIDMSGSSVDPLGLGQYRFNLAPQTKPPVTTPLDLTMTIAIEGFMGDLNVKFNGWSCTGFTGGTGTAVCTITSATPPEIELQVRQKTPLATLAATVEAADNVDPVQTNNLFTWMSVPLPPKP